MHSRAVMAASTAEPPSSSASLPAGTVGVSGSGAHPAAPGRTKRSPRVSFFNAKHLLYFKTNRLFTPTDGHDFDNWKRMKTCSFFY